MRIFLDLPVFDVFRFRIKLRNPGEHKESGLNRCGGVSSPRNQGSQKATQFLRTDITSGTDEVGGDGHRTFLNSYPMRRKVSTSALSDLCQTPLALNLDTWTGSATSSGIRTRKSAPFGPRFRGLRRCMSFDIRGARLRAELCFLI